MNKIQKIIFLILIAVFGAGVLFALPVNAQVDELIVEYWTGAEWKPLTGPLFNETNFLPGEGITRLVKVTNKSTDTQNIAVESINYSGFPNPDNVPAGDLSRALSIVIRKKDGSDLYGGTTGEKTLFDFYRKFGFNPTYEHVLTQNLPGNGGNVTYEFVITFPSEKENDWKGATTTFDILIGFQGKEGGPPPLPPPAGPGLPSGLTILEASATSTDITTTSVTIIWTTSYFSTSQVIYALGSESHLLDLTDSTGTPPKYGYARTTPEQDTSLKVTSHSVKIDDLAPGTIYYYRTVSHGSLAISTEHSFTTLGTGIEEKIEEEKSTEEGAVLGEKIFSTKEPTEKRIVLGERVSLAEKSIGKKAVLGEKVPPAEKSTEEGAVLDKEAPVAQEPTTAPQPITSRSLLASIGNIITLGTGSVIVGLLVVIAILALAGYAVYFLIQKTRRKN